MVEHLVVLVTTPSKEVGRELGRTLLERALAACVNIVTPIESLYIWEGTLCSDEEALLVIKTSARVFDELNAAIRDLHPYDVPEIIALPIVVGSQDYLAWVDQVIAS
jgi:periplasmic divalent cation tolerance protein